MNVKTFNWRTNVPRIVFVIFFAMTVLSLIQQEWSNAILRAIVMTVSLYFLVTGIRRELRAGNSSEQGRSDDRGPEEDDDK